MELPLFGPGLFSTAGNVENQLEKFGSGLLNRRFSGGDASGIQVDPVRELTFTTGTRARP